MVYIALIHYPVYDKNRNIIGTAVTSLDIHDIARVCRTYAVKKFFIITPFESQKLLSEKIIKHWTDGYGAKYNPIRKEALESVSVVQNLEIAIKEIKAAEGKEPLKIVTAARSFDKSISYLELGKTILTGEKPAILLFGTGWGLEESFIKNSDLILKPISGLSPYNHLSVRSAVAITLDRLLGKNL